jgi:hypothetical protein
MAQELLSMAAEWGRNVWHFVGNNAANIIALSAVGFTAYQAWLTRVHNRLSVQPHLQTHTDTHANLQESAFYYSIELRNNGLGPAIITKWTVLLDGVKQDLPDAEAVDTLVKSLFPVYFIAKTRFFGAREAMRANDSQTLLPLKLPLMNSAENANFKKQIERLDLIIECTSMYGEKLDPIDTRE